MASFWLVPPTSRQHPPNRPGPRSERYISSPEGQVAARYLPRLRCAATGCAAIAVLALAGPIAGAPAQEGGESCLTTDPPPVSDPARPLTFGITPQLAGSVGATQQEAVPLDPRRTRRALRQLRPRGRKLVLHLNRLFWADRRAGIRRFARLAGRYARAGFRSEIQVRYHPDARQEGDIEAWARYVRRVVRRLGSRPGVVGFTITNEANLPISPNTSDGAYEGVIPALVRGIVVADRELRRIGRPRLPVGFSVMWRWLPDRDAAFWEEIGARATPAFRRALDYVGLQIYPGLVWPPTTLPGRSAGEEIVEALTLVRRCFMPKASLGRRYELWVSENGYSTRPATSSDEEQLEKLRSTIRWTKRYSGTLNVTDYRYFNLRDNRSNGTDMFDHVGLLRDDYSRKPAFAEYRRLIRRHGN